MRTGARAAALRTLIAELGRPPVSPPPPPRLADFGTATRAAILERYRRLGGVQDEPVLRPGSWDLAIAGSVIELDEELHFNRYRAATIRDGLPWTDAYRHQCTEHEHGCLTAGRWGARWSSPSSTRLFGAPGEPGDLSDDGGAPRWKQRALYDGIKDAAAADGMVRLVRLSVHDDVAGVPLERLLRDTGAAALPALAELLDSRGAG